MALRLESLAPSLKVPNWMLGEPLTHFQSDKVYIVEVLAIWCKPYGITLPFDRESKESKGSNFRIIHSSYSLP
ncbi:hypothetical protein GOC38_30825 [Sinorhizobium meliloti]|nr:hypothetical protein [Sinorhizobium meliloti]MDX0327552.1 hypothetical protein [Sinorhizobium meliloti]